MFCHQSFTEGIGLSNLNKKFIICLPITSEVKITNHKLNFLQAFGAALGNNKDDWSLSFCSRQGNLDPYTKFRLSLQLDGHLTSSKPLP